MRLEFVEFSGLLTLNHKPTMEDGQRWVGKSVQKGLTIILLQVWALLSHLVQQPSRLYILSRNLYSLKVSTVGMHNYLEIHKMLDHFLTGLIPISHYCTILESVMYRIPHMFVYFWRGIEAVPVPGDKRFGKRLLVWRLLTFFVNAT